MLSFHLSHLSLSSSFLPVLILLSSLDVFSPLFLFFSLPCTGPGCFAMADAVKNGGLLLAPVLTLFLGIVCVHAQHILVNCSEMMRIKNNLTLKPDYAETVELCFATSKYDRCRSMAVMMRKTCNLFICITQFGFCCVYFVFIGESLKQVLDFYGLEIELRLLITIILLPIGLSALITNLKLLGECFSQKSEEGRGDN